MNKDPITINRFGTCPFCGHELMLLQSTHKAYQLSSSGFIKAKVDSANEFTAVCTHCNTSHPMKVTLQGLVPIEYIEENDDRPEILANNPISNHYTKEK